MKYLKYADLTRGYMYITITQMIHEVRGAGTMGAVGAIAPSK